MLVTSTWFLQTFRRRTFWTHWISSCYCYSQYTAITNKKDLTYCRQENTFCAKHETKIIAILSLCTWNNMRNINEINSNTFFENNVNDQRRFNLKMEHNLHLPMQYLILRVQHCYYWPYKRPYLKFLLNIHFFIILCTYNNKSLLSHQHWNKNRW